MSKLDTYLNAHQTLTAEQIRKQNEVLVKSTVENNSEIKKLQRQLREANTLNNKILENQLKEAKHKEEQKFYKAYVFKISELTDTISEIENSTLKYHFNNTYLIGTTDEVESVIEKLDEINDKQSAKETLKQIKNISKDISASSDNYETSEFPKLINLIHDYKSLESSIPIKPEFITKGNDFKKDKIIFWAIFHSVATIASLYLIFNNLKIFGGILTFIFGRSVYNEINHNSLANKFKNDTDNYYNNLIPEYEKKKAEILNLLEKHKVHSYIDEINKEFKDYSYYAKELEKIETKFHKKWSN